ncbi:hypothetical protein A0H81_15017, partial [Grifola frondosa]|jgi:hypothetical protein
MSGP